MTRHITVVNGVIVDADEYINLVFFKSIDSKYKVTMRPRNSDEVTYLYNGYDRDDGLEVFDAAVKEFVRRPGILKRLFRWIW